MTIFYQLKDGKLAAVRGLVTVGAVQKNAQFLTADEAASIDAYERADNSAEPREGYRAKSDGYELVDGKWATKWVYEPLSVEELTALYDGAMEAHLDVEKAERGYTDREPSDYAGSSILQWASDAKVWIAFRDKVMVYGLQVINHYKKTGDIPTMSEFKAALAAIPCEWENV